MSLRLRAFVFLYLFLWSFQRHTKKLKNTKARRRKDTKRSSEEKFSRESNQLYSIVKGLSEEILYVNIDGIQKISKLLDLVHKLIEETDKIFILTESSARKLKHGGANLLAGRAFVYSLYSLSCFELGEHFNLQQALE